MHRGEDGLELRLGVVAGRDARVLRAQPRGERVRRDVDAPAVLGDAEPREDGVDRRLLRLERDAQRGRGGVVGGLGGEGREPLGERVEDLAHARGGQAEVVVGEVGVVGVRDVGEARGVLAGELDVAPQRGGEGGEVVRGARGQPRGLALGGGEREIRRRGPSGSRRARSQSRRATRTRSRSIVVERLAVAVELVQPRRRSRRRSRGRGRGAGASRPGSRGRARRAGGIIVRWSHAARRARAWRSESSARRSRRLSRAGMPDRVGPA